VEGQECLPQAHPDATALAWGFYRAQGPDGPVCLPSARPDATALAWGFCQARELAGLACLLPEDRDVIGDSQSRLRMNLKTAIERIVLLCNAAVHASMLLSTNGCANTIGRLGRCL